MRALLHSLASSGRAAALLLLATGLCLSACSTAGTGPAAAVGVDNGLTVTISAPAIPPPPATGPLLVSGSMAVSGKVDVPAGTKLTSVVVTVGALTSTAKIQTGNKFSLDPPIDSKQLKDGGATVTVTANGTGGATGSAQVSIQVDNTAPTIQFLTPVDGDVKVGKVAIQIKVADKNFKSATLQYGVYASDNTAPTDFLPLLPTVTAPAVAAPITKPGTYNFVLDRSPDPSAKILLKLTATDTANNSPQEATVSVDIVRQPHFLGNSGDGDGFQNEIRDMQIADMNGDGILDAVLATSTGVAVTYGVPSTDDPTKGSGHFEPIKDPPPDTVVTTGKNIPGGSMTNVLLVDLDADGDLDVIAIGKAPDATLAVVPTAWALLNVEYDTVDKTTKAPVPGRALKLLDKLALPDEALSAALGDLNADGLQDVIIGSKNDKGLTTLMLQLNPDCKTASGLKKCKGIDIPASQSAADLNPITKVTGAVVFPKDTHTTTQFGVTAISSIAVADFFADDNNALDVCVGESARPIVSCYRNLKRDGTFEQAQDAYTMTDASDTRLVLATKWNPATADDTPDLIVASSSGIMRWLAGDHAGGLAFNPGKSREIIGAIPTDMVRANIGPGNTPYILYVEAGRVGTVVPLLPNDDSMNSMCFRSWILGGSVSKVSVGDVDNDGLLDIVSLDGASGIFVTVPATDTAPASVHEQPSALSVARGQPQQDFLAPTVHHLCALRPTGFFGVFDVSGMSFDDLNGDKKADLMLIGKRSWSLQPISMTNSSGGCLDPITGHITHKWAWAFHLFLNASSTDQVRLNPAPRGGEFAPNASGQTAAAGASTDCPDTPKSFGSVKDMAVADMDKDLSLDFVIARDESEYVMGGTSKDPTEGCPKPCNWTDGNEVDNFFGTDSPQPGIAAKCCKNFASVDKDKQVPLMGYGKGAPLDRASVFVFPNGNKTLTPFGLDGNGTPGKPKIMQPSWAMAGGINPMAVVAADFNSDTVMDVATLMQEKGSAQDKDKQYLEARVRVFKGAGGNKWNYVPQPDGDTWQWINPDTQLVEQNVAVNYRTVGRAPTAMTTAPLGKDGRLGLYTLGSKYGNFSFLESLGNMGFNQATHTVVGPTFGSFAASDINKSETANWTDVIFVLQNAIGVLLGNQDAGVPTFTPGQHLVDGITNVNFVDTVDANQDGMLDLMMIDTSTWSVIFYLGAGSGSFVRYDSQLRVLDKATRIVRNNLTPQDPASATKCYDLAVQSQFGATVLRNLDCM